LKMSEFTCSANTPVKIGSVDDAGSNLYFINAKDYGMIGMFGCNVSGTSVGQITTIFKNCIYDNFELSLDSTGLYLTSNSNNIFSVLTFGNIYSLY